MNEFVWTVTSSWSTTTSPLAQLSKRPCLLATTLALTQLRPKRFEKEA